jgi:LmbE family N-acetylglucosaminyl deacetylase
VKLLVAPHNDDECLFACWSILRDKPLVVVVFDGHVQQNRGLAITPEQRIAESKAACQILGVEVDFLGLRDDQPPSADVIRTLLEQRYGAHDGVYVPAWEEDGHHQHNLVAEACIGLPVVERYLTYTTAGKSTSKREVPFEGSWIGLKLRALACYESQFDVRCGCQPHFIGRSLLEYYA